LRGVRKIEAVAGNDVQAADLVAAGLALGAAARVSSHRAEHSVSLRTPVQRRIGAVTAGR
jgi:hypothetical protein